MVRDQRHRLRLRPLRVATPVGQGRGEADRVRTERGHLDDARLEHGLDRDDPVVKRRS